MSNSEGALPDGAYLAALVSMPGIGPARLGAVLDAASPEVAWSAALDGTLFELPGVADALQGRGNLRSIQAAIGTASRAADVAQLWARCEVAGIGVHSIKSPAYPTRLAADIEPPAVIFSRGDPLALASDRPLVAIVGTRQCTRYGVDIAKSMARELSAEGVSVISGLAAGIDAAAHLGALDGGGAPPIGVVGTGLDVVYPRRNANVWEAVASEGVLISEGAPGTRPERWRFPARNRVIAALADVVIVVESHSSGGSLITAEEAAKRGVCVMAVPGPITSPSSAGVNGLLADGAHPMLGLDDVRSIIGLAGRGDPRPDPRPPALGNARRLIDAFGWRPTTLDQLCDRTQLTVSDVVEAVDWLVDARWVARTQNGWLERVHDPDH